MSRDQIFWIITLIVFTVGLMAVAFEAGEVYGVLKYQAARSQEAK